MLFKIPDAGDDTSLSRENVHSINDTLGHDVLRESDWTERRAVGTKAFVEHIKEKLGSGSIPEGHALENPR